ncbi:Spc98 family-domain-containing protein [Amylocystis lapponica]|nr:Spc98 family-domain-containing protein [Amylocystis lapponica]
MAPRPSASAQGPSSSTRPSSSAQLRPSSRAAHTPLSAISVRPSSSASLRPSSSASSARPLSSLSRPTSRLTQRPGSRLTRPPTRQSSRLLPLYHALVLQLTGLDPATDPDNFRAAADFVSRNLDQTIRPAASTDMPTIDKRIRGRIQRARINSQSMFAAALETSQRKLKTHAEQNDDLDADIKMSRLPDHLQLLVNSSHLPDRTTMAFAEEYIDRINNPTGPPPALTWKTILDEEPFEGQHWEGAYGLPPGSTVEDWERHSGGSTPSLSPWDNSDDDIDASLSSSEVLDPVDGASGPLAQDSVDPLQSPSRTYAHRKDVEELQSRQYWRPEWRTDASTSRPFDIGDASTLGPSVYRALGGRLSLTIHDPSKEKYIHEHDAVREVLMGLQGRRNNMLMWTDEGLSSVSFVPSSSTRLLHLTAAAQSSILTPFAETATTVEHLRRFVSAVLQASLTTATDPARPVHLADKRVLLTLEAFAEAVDSQTREFDKWCAEKEEEICVAQGGVEPPLVVSLLSLEKAVRDRFAATFTVLLDLLRDVAQRALRAPDPSPHIWALPHLPMRVPPSACAALLLDLLLAAAQQHSSMGDRATADALMRVFSDTAEPLWAMVGRWLRDGAPVRDVLALRARSVDAEFFVEDNAVRMLDPGFWAEGFTLRGAVAEAEERGGAAVPAFLAHVAQIVLSTGKVVGLLRALGIPAMLDRGAGQQWLAAWRPFGALLASSADSGSAGGAADERRSVAASTDSLARLVYDELLPYSVVAHGLLTNVLVEDCDLWLHLAAMEDLYLMRRGDAMSHFTDVLFARMDSRQPWNDFHFLNSAFRDVAEAGAQRWIDASLVRFSHRGSKDKAITRTVRAIDGLLVEYAVPFPLTYIFGPSVLCTYSAVFAFVLQIRRAKNVLERILVRGALAGRARLGSELKVFYAMRSKLSWFVNTLLDFVLHTQVLAFHKALCQAESLDDIIQLHDAHSKAAASCSATHTAALQRAILAVLDMTLHFSECFVAFAGDTTHDISRQSLVVLTHHRSRRARRQRQNVVGFAQASRDAASDSDSDADADAEPDDHAEAEAEPSFSLGASSASFAEEGFVARLDKMGTELDALVRFVRRGVESLAAGAGEAASAFGVFAFALEDWDR